MSQTSEEKSLPPSERKLREARRKGQVAKSQDLVSGVVMLVSTLFLVFAASSLLVRLETLLDLGGRIYTDPFDVAFTRLLAVARQILLEVTVPLLAVVAGAVVLTNIATMKGLAVSAEPLVPRFEKINPVEGFKRLFSMRSVVEFLKGLVKVVALAVAFLVVFRLGLGDLFRGTSCGAPCLVDGFRALMVPLAATAVIAFLAVGLVDVLLQRWLFRRDMRMTKTERKRELRDTEGDPIIRRQRNKNRRSDQVISARTGLVNASVLIGVAGGPVVGVRYKRGETPVPMVVCRAEPDASALMIRDARQAHVPVIGDERLAGILARGAVPGRAIPEKTFQPVADLLVQVGAL